MSSPSFSEEVREIIRFGKDASLSERLNRLRAMMAEKGLMRSGSHAKLMIELARAEMAQAAKTLPHEMPVIFKRTENEIISHLGACGINPGSAAFQAVENMLEDIWNDYLAVMSTNSMSYRTIMVEEPVIVDPCLDYVAPVLAAEIIEGIVDPFVVDPFVSDVIVDTDMGFVDSGYSDDVGYSDDNYGDDY